MASRKKAAAPEVTPGRPTAYDPEQLYKVRVDGVFAHRRARFNPRDTFRVRGEVCTEIAARIVTAEPITA